MSISEKIKNILSPLFSVKNFKMYTATAELLETDNDNPTISVGDKATIDGAPAKGEILMENGQTFIFDDAGILQEVKEPQDDEAPEDKEKDLTDDQQAMNNIAEGMAALNSKFEELKAKNSTLETELGEVKTSALEITNKLVAANKVIEQIKNLKAPAIEDPKTDEPAKGKYFIAK